MHNFNNHIQVDNSLEDQISRSLLNHLYEGIYFVDKDRIIKLWNKGAKNITGYDSSEILNKGCYDNILCHKDEQGKELCTEGCPLVKCMEKDTHLDARVYLKHKNGHRVPVWIHVSPIKNKEGSIIGAVEVFINDSHYDDLKQVNKKLEDLNEQKNLFLGMTAHDLRNPLSVVIGFSSILLNYTSLNDKQSSMVKKITTACNTMLHIINDLLDITSIESGKVLLDKKLVTIDELLNIDNYSMKLIAEQKDIDIEVNIAQGLPKIFIDIKRMSQVIENLISNAVKFSYSGTKITINAYQKENQICISFIDQGQGISDEDLSKLFKPFQKTATKPTDNESSTGLGLAIVKKILSLHDSKIEVKSKLNKGSEFIIKIPINENT